MMPIVQHVLEVAPIPDGVTPERYQRGIAIGTMIQKVAVFLAPLGAALIFSIQAAILLGTSSVLSVGAKFRELFNLTAGCGLIQSIAAIAAIVVLKSKGDISTMAELRPALGLDIFLPEAANRRLPRQQSKGSRRHPPAGSDQSAVAHRRRRVPALAIQATMGMS
jgi:hypothetical protein